MAKINDQIIALLQKSENPKTLAEIADQLGKPQKIVFKGLQKLFKEGRIYNDVKTRTYQMVKE